MIATTVASSARFATASTARAPARCVVSRCMKAPEPETDSVPSSTSQGGVKDKTSVRLDAPSQPVDTAVLGPVQELINGRAAMLGVVAAATSELVTGQTVWSQIAGKYIDGELVEKAHGSSILYFSAIVVIFTMASLAPKLFAEDNKNITPADKEFGPFKASVEMLNGRAAMLGFSALLLVELVKQSPIF